jgi:hypothetical protein
VAEPLTDVGYQKSVGALTADIENRCDRTAYSRTLESLTITALIVNDGQIVARRYIAHEELEHFAASLITILSG